MTPPPKPCFLDRLRRVRRISFQTDPLCSQEIAHRVCPAIMNQSEDILPDRASVTVHHEYPESSPFLPRETSEAPGAVTFLSHYARAFPSWEEIWSVTPCHAFVTSAQLVLLSGTPARTLRVTCLLHLPGVTVLRRLTPLFFFD